MLEEEGPARDADIHDLIHALPYHTIVQSFSQLHWTLVRLNNACVRLHFLGTNAGL